MWFKMHKLHLSGAHLHTPNSSHMENLSEPENPAHKWILGHFMEIFKQAFNVSEHLAINSL